jgi:hypothetical protein
MTDRQKGGAPAWCASPDTHPVRGAIHGYVFDGERYRTIDFPGATRTEAWDITNSGDVIGYYSNADGRLQASAWTRAARTRRSTTRMRT